MQQDSHGALPAEAAPQWGRRLCQRDSGRSQHSRWWFTASLLSLAGLLICPDLSQGDEPVQPALAPLPAPEPSTQEDLPQVSITAPEPRYVAPTRRDRIGRIWAPVLINGQGPFRLVLDPGASHSGVTARVAETLGMPLDQSPPVMLRGVTGSAEVPTIRVDSLTVDVVGVGKQVVERSAHPSLSSREPHRPSSRAGSRAVAPRTAGRRRPRGRPRRYRSVVRDSRRAP